MANTPPDNAMITATKERSLAFRRLLADKPDFYDQVENYALLGASENELATFFGITRDTWLIYVKHSADLRDALDRGGAMADMRVAQAIHKRATGYEYTRQRIIVNKAGEGIVHDLTEHVPPDTAAGKFWLTNRQSTKWSDRGDTRPPAPNDGDTNINITFVSPQTTPVPFNITPLPANEETTDVDP